MFLFILTLLLIVQICNYYHYKNTKQVIINEIAIVIVLFINFYNIYHNKNKDHPQYKYILFIRISIIIVCLLFVYHYCIKNKNYSISNNLHNLNLIV